MHLKNLDCSMKGNIFSQAVMWSLKYYMSHNSYSVTLTNREPKSRINLKVKPFLLVFFQFCLPFYLVFEVDLHSCNATIGHTTPFTGCYFSVSLQCIMFVWPCFSKSTKMFFGVPVKVSSFFFQNNQSQRNSRESKYNKQSAPPSASERYKIRI